MPSAKKTVEVIPSAKRLILSLRDVGYDFVHAVADLVDNSIAAGASEVDIDLRFDGHESWLRIADNGGGMTGTTITEAMRFGADRDYEVDDLGKFGLGLKTASLSQCRRLTVASRVDSAARRIEVRQWDLDHVGRTNRWEIIDVAAADRPDHLIEPLERRPGTVVLWEELDRVLGYKIPWGERARAGLLRTTDNLYQHLAMVFHRFLAGEARRRKKLRIAVNGTPVEPWDPFARDERKTIRFADEQFEVQADDGRGLVGYTAYVLPHQHQFSTPRRFEHYSGPSKWNYQQGFYIYRADRMIQSGGWSWLRTADEHTKLARVALDFRPDLDSAFELNIAKARVALPAVLRDQVRPHVDSLVREARRIYDNGNTDAGPSPSGGTPAAGGFAGPGLGGASRMEHPAGTAGGNGRSNGDAHGANGTGAMLIVPSGRRLGPAIDAAARAAGETKALARIKAALREHNPEASNELGW